MLIGNLLLYYVAVLVAGFFIDKIWGINQPLWEFALFLTIGWGIYKAISFFIKNAMDKKRKRK